MRLNLRTASRLAFKIVTPDRENLNVLTTGYVYVTYMWRGGENMTPFCLDFAKVRCNERSVLDYHSIGQRTFPL